MAPARSKLRLLSKGKILPAKETKLAPLQLSEQATVVVVPRERFSCTPRAVTSVVRSLPDNVAVIVVDGAFPDDVRRELNAISRRRHLRLLRFEHYLLPPEARNRALPLVETPYVAFVDNDIDVRAGWLEALIDAAHTVPCDWCAGDAASRGPRRPPPR